MEKDGLLKVLESHGVQTDPEFAQKVIKAFGLKSQKFMDSQKPAQSCATLVYNKYLKSMTLYQSIRSASRQVKVPESTIRSYIKKNYCYEDNLYLIFGVGGENNG